jgi:hypothetical protein
MEEQSYKKHVKLVPPYHFFLGPLILIALVLSAVNLYRRFSIPDGRTTIVVLAMDSLALLLVFFFARVFALKAQDRAIRAEENLRHYALTGKLLDPRLTIQQIIGLRFASDTEFPALARKAAEQGMSTKAIKEAVQSWRADHDRL